MSTSANWPPAAVATSNQLFLMLTLTGWHWHKRPLLQAFVSFALVSAHVGSFLEWLFSLFCVVFGVVMFSFVSIGRVID